MMTPYEYGQQLAVKMALATPGQFRNYYPPKQMTVSMVGDVDLNNPKIPKAAFEAFDAKTNWLPDVADMSP